ncbi:MAG: hypothetical protein K2K45_04105 [Muribaculaceae bacterium]|nr:hypothetical protein [Muribaculaceae bacterium]
MTHARGSPVMRPYTHCLSLDSIRAVHGSEDCSSDDLLLRPLRLPYFSSGRSYD